MTARPHVTLHATFRIPLRPDGNAYIARLRAGDRAPTPTYSAFTGEPTGLAHIKFAAWSLIALACCGATAAILLLLP